MALAAAPEGECSPCHPLSGSSATLRTPWKIYLVLAGLFLLPGSLDKEGCSLGKGEVPTGGNEIRKFLG